MVSRGPSTREMSAQRENGSKLRVDGVKAVREAMLGDRVSKCADVSYLSVPLVGVAW